MGKIMIAIEYNVEGSPYTFENEFPSKEEAIEKMAVIEKRNGKKITIIKFTDCIPVIMTGVIADISGDDNGKVERMFHSERAGWNWVRQQNEHPFLSIQKIKFIENKEEFSMLMNYSVYENVGKEQRFIGSFSEPVENEAAGWNWIKAQNELSGKDITDISFSSVN